MSANSSHSLSSTRNQLNRVVHSTSRFVALLSIAIAAGAVNANAQSSKTQGQSPQVAQVCAATFGEPVASDIDLPKDLYDLKRPPNFQSEGATYVFGDFTNAHYSIKFDVKKQQAVYLATMEFETFEDGRIVFDSVTLPYHAQIDGKDAEVLNVESPDSQTTYVSTELNLKKGKHTIVIEGAIDRNQVVWGDNEVRIGFMTSDLDDRQFLEAYLPASFEYDQLASVFDVEVLNSSAEYELYTNAKKETLSNTAFRVRSPSHFNSSSLYFHLLPKSARKEAKGEYVSIDGRKIPITAYVKSQSSENPARFVEEARRSLKKNEEFFGAYAHDAVLIYGEGSGGMEYNGATITELWALDHELRHSWFARGVIPANGSAGWLDEAITTWGDNGFPVKTTLNGNAGMASHGPYTRLTDSRAYKFGASFIAYLSGTYPKFNEFLRWLFANHRFLPLTTETFIGLMSHYLGEDVMPVFKRYVYTSKGAQQPSLKEMRDIHPHEDKDGHSHVHRSMKNVKPSDLW